MIYEKVLVVENQGIMQPVTAVEILEDLGENVWVKAIYPYKTLWLAGRFFVTSKAAIKDNMDLPDFPSG